MAGGKHKLLKMIDELSKEHCLLVITCNEQISLNFRNHDVILFDNLLDLPSILSSLKETSIVVIDFYDLIRTLESRYSKHLARRIIEKVFIQLYAFSKARNVDVYVLSPLNLTNNEPLINPPNYMNISKVKLL